ncbi:MAG: hypothetical protein GEV28_23375 [Actinophytocola sp.]|uniref:hypothetical protein n=1 Tax=Actinophytocola sp. TaxID=1872138 RepID=UPI001326502B|nr:hypothetical protein [Actinophytocola sp.]MPZ83172.1 hypothetical protein [Actinophytocola sp.]
MTGDDYSMAYQVGCAPGPNAAVAMAPGPGGMPVLVVYLDPVNMVIHSASSPAANRDLAGFCRELAREATRLADAIDPAHGPRHLLRDEVSGDA